MTRLVTCLVLSVCLALPLGSIEAQGCGAFQLTTNLVTNNGFAGNMFDLQPTSGAPLRIQSFDVINTITTATLVYEVWVRTQPLQSYTGFTASNAGWTLLGTSAPIAGAGTGTAVPLNLCLGYLLQPGGRTGFYVTVTGGVTGHQYTNGVTQGALQASDVNLSIFEGHGGPYFALTNVPRDFSGRVRYDFGYDVLSMSQSGPGIGDLTVTLGNISPTAFEGLMLLSAITTQPVGTGPIFGVVPDALFWTTLTYPYVPGSPFHFRTTDVGLFPSAPFYAPPGSLSALTGASLDFVVFMIQATGAYDGRSNVLRFAFN